MHRVISEKSPARRVPGTRSWRWDSGNRDHLGCQGNRALRSSFMYTSPVQLPAAAEKEGSGFSSSFPALCLLCMTGSNCVATEWFGSFESAYWIVRIANPPKLPLFFGQVRKLIWLILCRRSMLEQGKGKGMGPSLSADPCNKIRLSAAWSHTLREADQLKGWSQCV